jgi:hypothetical protein
MTLIWNPASDHEFARKSNQPGKQALEPNLDEDPVLQGIRDPQRSG